MRYTDSLVTYFVGYSATGEAHVPTDVEKAAAGIRARDLLRGRCRAQHRARLRICVPEVYTHLSTPQGGCMRVRVYFVSVRVFVCAFMRVRARDLLRGRCRVQH